MSLKDWVIRNVPGEPTVVPFEDGLKKKYVAQAGDSLPKDVDGSEDASEVIPLQSAPVAKSLYESIEEEYIFKQFGLLQKRVLSTLDYLDTQPHEDVGKIIRVLRRELNTAVRAEAFSRARLTNPDMVLPDEYNSTDPEVILILQISYIEDYLKGQSIEV